MDLPAALVERLRGASRVATLTGAGVSAESGVPTFRQAQTGLWARYDPQELATPEAFARQPGLVWRWYAWRRGLVAQARPNPAHDALARMPALFERFTLITQNVDGLHQRAGSREVVELHGSLARVKCSRGCGPVAEFDEGEEPGRCPRCNGLLRPDVVWFGEPLPEAALDAAWAAARDCELFLCVGTSALVQPAASLPFAAREAGAMLVEVNPEQTPLTPHAHFALQGAAGEVLPRLVRALD